MLWNCGASCLGVSCAKFDNRPNPSHFQIVDLLVDLSATQFANRGDSTLCVLLKIIRQLGTVSFAILRVKLNGCSCGIQSSIMWAGFADRLSPFGHPIDWGLAHPPTPVIRLRLASPADEPSATLGVGPWSLETRGDMGAFILRTANSYEIIFLRPTLHHSKCLIFNPLGAKKNRLLRHSTEP